MVTTIITWTIMNWYPWAAYFLVGICIIIGVLLVLILHAGTIDESRGDYEPWTPRRNDRIGADSKDKHIQL